MIKESKLRKLKNFIEKSSLKFLFDLYVKWKGHLDLKRWQKEGKLTPPPHIVKQMVIRQMASEGNCKILVETGTYLGDMIYAQLDYFKSIYSIELSQSLYDNAVKRVKRFKKYKNVHLFFGNSADTLGLIIKDISEPIIFWLDGHYSGGITAKGESECPIWAELNQITALKNLEHVILIDDARYFNGKNDYPTIEELQQYFIDKNNCHYFEVKDDIIRIFLKFVTNNKV